MRARLTPCRAYCMSFRREAVNTVGLMREVFRFYRNLDIDYCFQFKDKGYRVLADASLPIVRHEHRQWTELDDNQRDELFPQELWPIPEALGQPAGPSHYCRRPGLR